MLHESRCRIVRVLVSRPSSLRQTPRESLADSLRCNPVDSYKIMDSGASCCAVWRIGQLAVRRHRGSTRNCRKGVTPTRQRIPDTDVCVVAFSPCNVRVSGADDRECSQSSPGMGKGKKSRSSPPGTVTLKQVAERVGLAPGTVSAVLNDCPSARSIPQPTWLRIQAAARELNYRPNFLPAPCARSVPTRSESLSKKSAIPTDP